MNLVTRPVAIPEIERQANRFGRLWDDNSLSILALALLFALETVMFYAHLADQILPYFPRAFDQTSYTVETYQLIDQFRAHGWAAYLHKLFNPDATGASFSTLGALLSLIGGANRGAFLSLNLIYFIALQICLFVSVRRRTESVAPAWLAIAFLLSIKTHFNFAGNLYDYRIDYSALCLYGIFCSLLISSHGFVNRNVALAIAAVSVLLILERFFTILYVGSVLVGLFLYALTKLTTQKCSAHDATRAKNLFVCGGVILLCVSPFLFLARDAIYSYYVVGHFLNNEKYIRAAENGIKSLWDDLTYYPWSIETEHFGTQSLEFIGAVLLVLIALCVLGGVHTIRDTIARLRAYGFEFLGLTLAVVVPLILLTLDYSKSPVVGGIVTVPCILFVVLFASALQAAEAWPLSSFSSMDTRKCKWLREIASAACIVIGLAMFLANGTAPQHSLSRADLERINGINNAISGYIIDNAMADPSISFDRVIEYLNAGTVQLAGWEHWGRLIELAPKFGAGEYGIFATPRETAMKLLQDSDFVVLSDPRLGREGSAYPMDTEIREYWSNMWQWANANLLLLYETNIGGIPYRVFHKPTIKSQGGSGDWITSQGLGLIVSRSDLMRWPFVVLEGDNNNSILGGEPRAQATAQLENAPSVRLPARIATTGTKYRLVIDAHAAIGSSGQVIIQLTFDRYFVPKQRGINDDTRQLVMKMPASEELRAKESGQ